MPRKRSRRRRYDLNQCILSLRLIEIEARWVRKSLEAKRDQEKAKAAETDSASAESRTDSAKRS